MTTCYDIFISYRRDGGFETAKHLNDLLVHDGYTVSFDIDTLREGDFDETLLKRIDVCVDFIVIIDKHTFDRTLNPAFDTKNDWLRIELAYALKLRKNIVPILLSGVDHFPINLPEDIAEVTTKNGPIYNRYYFDEFYKRLKTFLHCFPRNAQHGSIKNAIVTFHSITDTSIFVDGTHILDIQAGVFVQMQVPLGEHIFKYVSIKNPAMSYTEKKSFNEVQNYIVEIKYSRIKNVHFNNPFFLKCLGVAGVIILIVVLISFWPKLNGLIYDTKVQDIPTEVDVKYDNNTLYVNGTSYKMINIKGGDFNMGIKGSQEAIKHKVTLSDYQLGETEVPQFIWETIMNTNPSHHIGNDYPVEQVSWNDCQLFIRRLNALSGQTFRLPTEAEWEYAASHNYSDIHDMGVYAWYAVNSGHWTHSIGMKKPTGMGLKDMFGNVWEWCEDKYAVYAENYEIDPHGPVEGDMRSCRGGGCGSERETCTPTFRSAMMPTEQADAVGFRLAK